MGLCLLESTALLLSVLCSSERKAIPHWRLATLALSQSHLMLFSPLSYSFLNFRTVTVTRTQEAGRKISTSVSTQWAFVTLLKGAWHLESRVTGSYQRWDLGKRGFYSPLLLCVVPPQLTERRVWLEVRGRGSCLLCRGLEGRPPVGPGKAAILGEGPPSMQGHQGALLSDQQGRGRESRHKFVFCF